MMSNLKLIATQTLSMIANAIREKDPDLNNPPMTPLQMPNYIRIMDLHGYKFDGGEGGVAFNHGTNLRAKFQNSTLKMYPIISNQVTDMHQAFNNCRNLVGTPMCNDNVIYGCQMYRDCWNLTGEPQSGDNIQDMSLSYYNDYNLTGNAPLGPNVTNASQCYYNCSNLNGLIHINGSNIINLRQTFWNCSNLRGIINNIDPTVTLDTYQAFYNCQNIGGSPVCGSAVTDMTSMYENCFNITGRPVCAPNVTIMNNTYQNCYNLTGPAAIGPKVTAAYNVYRNCKGITEAIMPNTVIRIDNGFTDCPNLGRAFLSTNCQVLYYIFNNCQNLTGSIIAAKETQYTQHCFYNCFKLQGVYIIGNDNTASSIMNVARSLNGFNRIAIDDPNKLSRLNVVFSRRATMQKLASSSVTGCAMTAVETLAADNKIVSLPLTYANGQIYGYKNYTCTACQKNEMYNLYFYSLN